MLIEEIIEDLRLHVDSSKLDKSIYTQCIEYLDKKYKGLLSYSVTTKAIREVLKNNYVTRYREEMRKNAKKY